jgi:serine/threonine-protein kinase
MPGIQGRFKREAETSSRLEHPNIVQTFEMSQDGPYTYIVSEYVDGGSLIDLIVREKQLTPRRACELALDILSALDHAHGRGVVHRDIKPGNVLVTTEGRAKVIDFGLAKDAEANTILTLSGNVVGTPAFMAPEQAMGEPAGALADLYSTGILLYLMLTGKKPFEGKSIVDTLHKQINEPLPSPRALNPDVPEELELVLKRICAKQASKRPAGLQEAMAAIRKAVGMEPPAAAAPAAPAPAPAPAPADADEWGWLWAAGGLLALAAAIVYRVFSR